MLIRLGGEVSATVDGVEVDLGPAKSKAVFAALALSPGSPVAVSRLISLVWGDDPPRTADKTLQSYVTRLRKSCGSSSIERVGDAYRLCVDATAVDLVAFEQLLDDGRASEALAAWNGRPLAGASAEGFEPIVARLEERYLSATETMLEARVDRGDGAAVVDRLRELTTDHPLREGLWALLMRALYQSGRQADALRAYGQARDILVDELGVDPGPALRDLERRILEHDEALLPDAPAAGSPSPPDDQRSFLFTDIEDSTGLWARHPDEMATAVADHDAVIAAAVEGHGGEIVKHTGDGVLATFPTPSDAVQAAVSAQLGAQRLVAGGEPVAVRMAISTGRADHRDDDWFGPPLNVAARLLDGAHGGQIVMAGSCHSQLGNDIDPAVTTSDLGLLHLRGLSRPEHVHQVLHPALPRRFGPMRTETRPDDDIGHEFPPQLSFTHGVPFVGRGQHLGVLRRAWDEARVDREPRFVLVAGEPGVGKTRLAAAVARSNHDEHGATVVYGRCTEDYPTPFRPFTEALTSYGRGRPDAELRTEMGPHPELLAPVIPLLLERFGDVAAATTDGEVGQLDVFDAVTAFLEIASSSPLVIVLDDIHWADRASLDLLLHLARHQTVGRLLVIATYRDVEVDRTHPLSRLLADLRREERVERIAVRGIDATEAVEFTEAMIGHELSEDGRQAAAQAAADANGNPFFIQEMLRHFMESGTLVRRQGRWTTNDVQGLADSVPEGIREVVGRRLDQISEPCNTLLRTASAFVGDVDVDLLVAVSQFGEDEVLDLLDEALEAGLLIDSSRQDRYEFSHALIRQSLYREFSTARRLRLHRKIADTLVGRARDDATTVNAIAHHYLAAATAAEPGAVALWARRSAAGAVQRLAFEEAADLLERALDATDGELDADDHLLLTADLAGTWLRLGDARAESGLAEVTALRAGASAPARATAAVTISRSIISFSVQIQFRETVRALFGGVDRSALDGDTRSAFAVEQLIFGIGDIELGEVLAGIEHALPVTLRRAANLAGRLILGRDQLVDLTDRIAVAAARTSEPSLRAVIPDMVSAVEQMTWQRLPDQPSSLPSRAIGRLDVWRLMSSIVIGVRTGRPDLVDRATLQNAVGVMPIVAVYRQRWLDYEADRLEVGREPLPEEFSGAPVASGMYLMPHMRETDLDAAGLEALVESGRSGDLTDPVLSSTMFFAQLVAETGATSLAGAVYDRLKPASGLGASAVSAPNVTAVDHHLGSMAALTGRRDEAIELFRRSIDQTRSMGFVLDEAYSVVELIRLLGERNDAGDVDEAKRVAAATVTALEATPYTRRVRLIDEALNALRD